MKRAQIIVNRTAVLTLPAVGIIAAFLTMVLGYHLDAVEAAPSALAFASDTFLLVATLVGVAIVACDCIIPKRRSVIFGIALVCATITGAVGWIVGTSAMHI